jgi:transmembrane sensor
MKARLRLPLRSTIQDGFDEGDVLRIWRGIRTRRPRRRLLGWLAVSLAVVTSAALWLALPRLTAGHRPGPLRLASGDLPGMLLAELGPRRLALADGSAILASPHTKVDVLVNDAKLFLTALRRGAVRIEVQPGGPRRWVIECGPVSIEVVGTELEVERSADEVVVSVVRGVVVVRGARVPDHVQRLGAGDRLAISTAEAPLPQATIPASSGPTELEPALGPASGRARTVPGTATASPRSNAEELIRRADAARRSGDLPLAKRLLGQSIETAQGAPSGAVAALTLVRLTMNDDPAGAAAVLARALRAGMPHGLEEDARARLVEARARSGDSAGAGRAAREYRQRFPQGARSEEVRRWVAE